MKQLLKRLTAMALLLCILLSFAVPATWAEEENEGRTVATYDIWLYDSALEAEEGYNSLFPKGNTRHIGLASLKEDLDTLYADEQINWTYIASGNESNLQYRTSSMLLRLRGGTNNWAALKIKVPEDGNFALTYSVDTSAASFSGSVTAWVFALSELDGTDVPSLMSNANCLGTQDMTGKDEITFEAKAFTQGEYVVVYQGSVNDIWLGELGLVEASGGTTETTETAGTVETTEMTTAPGDESAPVATYDFVLYNETENKGYNDVFKGKTKNLTDTCGCGCGMTVAEHLAGAYESLGWMYLERTAVNSKLDYRADTNWGLRVQPAAAGDWIAFKLAVPAAGTYRLRYNASAATAHKVGGYVFSTAELEATVNGTVAELMESSSGHSIGSVEVTTEVTAGVFTPYNFEAGEYILVLKHVDKTFMRIGSLELIDAAGEDVTDPSTETTEPDQTTAPTLPEDYVCGGTYTEGVFNFAIYTEESRAPMFTTGGVLSDRRYDAKCYGCGQTIQKCLAEQYAAGQLNWILEGTSFGNITVMGKSYRENGYGGVRFRYDTDENGEPIMTTDKNGKPKNQETAGNFVAYRVKVANPGTYTLTVARDYPAGFAADVFVFPAPEEAMTRADLTASLTEENKIGAAEFTETTASSKAGDYTFGAAGEYIIALKTTSGKRLYLNTITLATPQAAQPIPAVNEKYYNFDLSTDDAAFLNKPINGRYNADGSVRIHQQVTKLYGDGKILWNYETKSDTTENSVISFRTGCLRLKSTVNFRDLSNQWVAFRLKNPGTATYDIRLESGKTASKMYANFYLIPLNTVLTQSAAQIEAAMTKENRFLEGAIFNDSGTFYLGEYTFGTEEEYLLVVEPTKGTLLHISNLRMTLDDTVADGTIQKEKIINGMVYDFDVNDPLNGWFTDSKILMPDICSQLNAMWASGTLKWKWEGACEYLTGEGNTPSSMNRFYKNTGLRTYYYDSGNWQAFRIKSPGNGEFTLTLNHALMANSGTIAVYILPGDTENIEFAMDPKNRVGKVAMYNDGSSGVTDGQTSFVGYWDFEAGKEYIVVFESYYESPFVAGNCTVNISQLVAQRGHMEYETAEDKSVKSTTVAKNVIPVADPLYNNVVTQIYGHDYYFLPVEGGSCLVYDLDTGEFVDEIPIGYSRTMDVRVDSDGMIWFSGAGKYLVRYDPYTQEAFKTSSFLNTPGLVGTGANSICPTPDGKIWFATYYNGVLGYYDYQTDEYTVWGQVMDTPRYTTGMMYHNGYLYMAANNDEKALIIKFDTQTQKVVATTDVTHLFGTATYLNNLSMLGDGDLLVGGVNSNKLDGFIAVDPETMELVEVEGIFGYMNMGATEIIDGKQYLVTSGYGLYEYDVATKTFSKTPGFGNDGIGFKSKDGSLITLNGDRCLFTYTSTGGHPRIYNLDTKEYKTWDDLVRHGSGGAEIHGVFNGENDGKLYIGVYNTPQYGIYDEAAGKVVGYVKTGGQGDSGIWYEGKFYTGNYSSTTLNEIPVEEASAEFPAVNDILQRLKLDHEETGQKRIHSLAAGDGKVFAGSIPDTGVYGGSITVYDTKTGRWFYDRSPVGDLAVTKVVYCDKLVWAGTSTAAGTGTTTAKPEGSSAMIVAYDYENRQTVARLDLRQYISGLPKEIDFIAGFEKDPVVENRFWGIASETLFCFTFDKETLKFNVQEVLSFDKTECDATAGRQLWSRPVLFDTQRNSIYFSFDTNGGFQCIEIADWNADIGSLKVKQNTRIMGDTPKWYAMGQDGEIYYGDGPDLKMLPLNITDEDWEIAGAVDQMILDLGQITLESEAAIKSARSAYDNLSWRYKALIQQLELLQEAETDLLECKIEPIVVDDVDADSLPELQTLVDTYKGMNTRQQKYVKNYSHLQEAYAKASKLNDERVAAALQNRIDALGEKFPLTLDDEPEVLAIRADYDAMSGTQRSLMDITILEDAEAQIKVLRSEFVKYTETLIQAIPDEITLSAEPAITAAREAADKLYTGERKNVSYAKLTSAEGKLRTLKNAKTKAEEVDALIDAIGIVTLGDKERIAEAREAYDALNSTALTFLQNGKKLQRAEWILKALQTWAIPVMAVAAAGAVFCIVWFVPSLHSKVFKTKKKEETEAIDN